MTIDPNQAARSVRVLDAGWMIDGCGGPTQRRVRLVFHGDTIARIEKISGSIIFSDGYVDCRSDTVLPGLIDAHLHLALSATEDQQTRQDQLLETYPIAKNGMCRRIARMLSVGIVAGRDAGDANAHALQFRQDGMPGAPRGFRLRAAGRGWHAAGRYGRFIGRPPEDGMPLEDAVEGEPFPGDHLKILNSGLNSLSVFGRETLPQFSRETLRAAVTMAASRGRDTMVHANGRQPVADAIAAGACSIEHGYFMGIENIRRMAESHLFWAPTVVPMAVHARRSRGPTAAIAARTVDHQLGQITEAHRLGVPLVTGTDAGGIGVHHGKALIEEMALFLQAGLSLSEMVQAASGTGARLMGWPAMGVLAPGKRACIVVAPGHPEDLPGSLNRVKFLIVDGAVIPSVVAEKT